MCVLNAIYCTFVSESCAIDFRTAGGAWDSTSGIKAGDGFEPVS